jgi:hypothetical protein
MKGCKDTPGIADSVIIDDCAELHKSGCLAGHHRGMNSDKWNIGLKPGNPPEPEPLAIVSSNMNRLVIEASTELGLSMSPWVKTSAGQQWTVGATAVGPTGPGNTLTLGEGVGICPGRLPCCMTVHHDIVPDGDGGWSVVALLVVVLGLYFGVSVDLLR